MKIDSTLPPGQREIEIFPRFGLIPFAIRFPTTIGTALSLIFIGGAAGKFACGVLAERMGIIRTVIVTELATALLICGLLALPLTLAFFLMLPLGIALNGTSSVLYGSVAELAPPSRRARAFALFYTVTLAAGALAPLLYGLIGDRIGISQTLLLVAAVVLLVLPLAGRLAPHFRNESRT